jgi:hypothetical protein
MPSWGIQCRKLQRGRRLADDRHPAWRSPTTALRRRRALALDLLTLAVAVVPTGGRLQRGVEPAHQHGPPPSRLDRPPTC